MLLCGQRTSCQRRRLWRRGGREARDRAAVRARQPDRPADGQGPAGAGGSGRRLTHTWFCQVTVGANDVCQNKGQLVCWFNGLICAPAAEVGIITQVAVS